MRPPPRRIRTYDNDQHSVSSMNPIVPAAVMWLVVASTGLALSSEPLRIAGVTTVYYHNSHSDIILGRMLEGYNLDGKDPFPPLRLASLYIDQFPENDIGRRQSDRYRVPLFRTASDAVTRGGPQLAVDGVLLIAEHGKYPVNDAGSIIYPKRPMFAAIARVCEQSRKSVPVFIDKHLADNWTDAKWIYDEAQRLKLPLMAGSSIPGLWRTPAADTRREQPLREIVVVAYHSLEQYGFHAIEVLQCLAERRRGGETGVKQVQVLGDAAAWHAIDAGRIDRELLREAMSRYKDRPLPKDPVAVRQSKRVSLLLIDYRDGLRGSILLFEDRYLDFSAAWRYGDGSSDSTCFWTQEARPFYHFALLLKNLEPFLQTGQPAWPVERTLLTTGLLDSLLISRRDSGRVIDTPHLAIGYQSDWNWRIPPDPPADRPIYGQ